MPQPRRMLFTFAPYGADPLYANRMPFTQGRTYVAEPTRMGPALINHWVRGDDGRDHLISNNQKRIWWKERPAPDGTPVPISWQRPSLFVIPKADSSGLTQRTDIAVQCGRVYEIEISQIGVCKQHWLLDDMGRRHMVGETGLKRNFRMASPEEVSAFAASRNESADLDGETVDPEAPAP